jgi:hypothetical protein
VQHGQVIQCVVCRHIQSVLWRVRAALPLPHKRPLTRPTPARATRMSTDRSESTIGAHGLKQQPRATSRRPARSAPSEEGPSARPSCRPRMSHRVCRTALPLLRLVDVAAAAAARDASACRPAVAPRMFVRCQGRLRWRVVQCEYGIAIRPLCGSDSVVRAHGRKPYLTLHSCIHHHCCQPTCTRPSPPAARHPRALRHSGRCAGAPSGSRARSSALHRSCRTP